MIVHIDSPGGTIAGSEQLYDALVRLKAKKPMVVVVDGLAASGGYIAAMASDHIIAQQSSLVGSIGVIFQYPNFTDLLKTIGVKVEEHQVLAAQGCAERLEPTSPEARAAVEALVMDSYDWFKTLVRDRRNLDPAALDKVTDGRVFTGRQALELKLIDALGDEKAAVDWLAKTHPCSGEGAKPATCIDPKTPVRDYRLSPRFSDLPFLHTAMIGLLDAVGLRALAERFKDWGTFQAVERLNLDGLLALWHPPMTN